MNEQRKRISRIVNWHGHGGLEIVRWERRQQLRRRLRLAALVAVALLVGALALWLSGCAAVVVVTPPPLPTATPAPVAACPALALAGVDDLGARQRIRLTVTWDGPGTARVRLPDFAIVDDAGRLYVVGDTGQALVGAAGEPAELTVDPVAGARLVEVRLDYPGCAPVAVPLGER